MYPDGVNDIEATLRDLAHVRAQLAASSRFEGLAPGVIAMTGGFAFALGLWQRQSHETGLIDWIALAAVSALAVMIESIARARTRHRILAWRMMGAALGRFLPVIAAGGLAGLAILLFAPAQARVLPGLWQILIGVGGFAIVPSLPRGMALAAGFYLATGAVSLALAGQPAVPLWLLMALPFGTGQLLAAAILWRGGKGRAHG